MKPVDATSARAAETAIQATLDAFDRLDALVLDLGKWRSGVGQDALDNSPSTNAAALPILRDLDYALTPDDPGRCRLI